MDKMQAFVVWLDGYLDATEGNINISKTNLIKNKLNGLFEHEAETPTNKPNKTLQELGEEHGFPVYVGFETKPSHITKHNKSDKELYRC